MPADADVLMRTTMTPKCNARGMDKTPSGFQGQVSTVGRMLVLLIKPRLPECSAYLSRDGNEAVADSLVQWLEKEAVWLPMLPPLTALFYQDNASCRLSCCWEGEGVMKSRRVRITGEA